MVDSLSGSRPAAAPGRERAKVEAILTGTAKPADEREAALSAWALLWKKAFEEALKPMDSPGDDPLTAPQAHAIRDRQAAVMGIEAALALSAGIGAQVAHLKAGQSARSSKLAPLVGARE